MKTKGSRLERMLACVMMFAFETWNNENRIVNKGEMTSRKHVLRWRMAKHLTSLELASDRQMGHLL